MSFRRDVAPILVRKCLGCHNDRKADAGLNLSTFEGLKAGGEGAGVEILMPGDPDASHLVEVVRPDAEPRMPYKLPPLTNAEIAALERWVRQGAAYDGPEGTATPIASLIDPTAGLPAVAPTVPVSDPVAAAAFAPDGSAVALAVGAEVHLHRGESPKPARTLAGAPGPIAAVAFTPDGRRVIAAGGRAGRFGAVTVWEAGTGTIVHDLRGHADAVLAAALSPDGSTLATASYDGLVLLWDLDSGAIRRTLREHTDAVHGVAFAPDGRLVASASADRTIKLWDPATGRRLATLSDPTGEQAAVAFSPDGSALLAAGSDRMIRAWDARTRGNPLLRSAFAHDGSVLRLVPAPDGRAVYSAGSDRAVRAWEFSTLRPLPSPPAQPDWPLALAVRPDGSRLVVGRFDGSAALIDPTGAAPPVGLREAPAAAPTAAAPAALVRAATLNPPSPRGSVRGGTRRVVLNGADLNRAVAVLVDGPGIGAAIVEPRPKEKDRLEVDLAIAPDAPSGVRRIAVQTHLGVTPSQPFAVSAHPEVDLDRPIEGPAALPSTLVGAIEAAGDVDEAPLAVAAGRTLVVEVVARALGSALRPRLELVDASGRTVAEAVGDAGPGEEANLSYTPAADAALRLRVADAEAGGSGGHFYRIAAGMLPRVASAFPLGVARGEAASVALEGANLGDASTATVRTDAPAGTPVAVPLEGLALPLAGRHPLVVAADGPQGVEAEPNDDSEQANPVATPGGLSGRIDRPGDVDLVRFEAKAGETWIVEAFARRVGSPVDPAIEVLDAQGRPIPRAVLRPVAETQVAFRDHDSGNPKIRLTRWDHLTVGDALWVGRELVRIHALPRNPDDDCTFWSAGGRRLGLLETTPGQHPMGRTIQKVEIHPPGTTFPRGGAEPITLTYRNDDGGPPLGKDARVTFTAPADGTYLARVEDVRGLGGPGSGYHLVVRRPRPDALVTLSTADPNVPRGASAVVAASVLRLDDYDGPIDLEVEGLPPGITATTVRVEPGQMTGEVLLSADATAPAYSPPTWRVVARSPDGSIRHELDPGGPSGGRITVTPPADLAVAASPARVEIRPGATATLTLAVERRGGLEGRVPIEVRNLPHGVRVLDVGLNGVLVTEAQRERSVTLYAEPWAEPAERPVFAEARLQTLGPAKEGLARPVTATGREAAGAPITLVVTPGPGPGGR